jgi:large repetitive protein
MGTLGCSVTCQVMRGWKCFGGSSTTADVCVTKCGDGILAGTETCDDGNLVNGDGCDSTCLIEFGWACFN